LRFPPVRENEPPPEIGALYILDFFFKVARDILITYKKKKILKKKNFKGKKF